MLRSKLSAMTAVRLIVLSAVATARAEYVGMAINGAQDTGAAIQKGAQDTGNSLDHATQDFRTGMTNFFPEREELLYRQMTVARHGLN